jgi:hypothetical protein
MFAKDSSREADVERHGAGHVGRSSADSITTLQVARSCLEPRTTMMETAVVASLDSKKRTIVLEGTAVTVGNDGKSGLNEKNDIFDRCINLQQCL